MQSSVHPRRLRIGTRGSPLALAQARMVRERLAAAHGFAARAHRDRDHPHHRRPHPGSAAGGGRRQGPVHQGDRGGAAGRHDRFRRAFGQGHADRAAGRADARGVLPREDVRDVFISRKAPTLRDLPAGARSAPRRCAGRRWSSACGRISTSCRFAATSRPGCASSRPARSMRRCWRSPGSKRLGLADAATASVDRRVPARGWPGRHRDRGARRRRRNAAARRRSTTPTPRPLSPPSARSSRARRLLPHADRRTCHGRRMASSRFRGMIVQARRQRSVSRRAREGTLPTPPARRRRRPRAQAPRRCRLSLRP